MKVLSVASARPNFVKLAAIDHAVRMAHASSLEHVIVHTGQHYDPLFSDVFFEQLDIRLPTANLGVHGGTRAEAIQKTDDAITPVLREQQPDIVLVYGDVNGAVGAAHACSRLGIRLAHVEAGLRSFDTTMPEELNRADVDVRADMLFCTEESAVTNLKNEKVKGDIHLVGNTMIDTLLRMLPRMEQAGLPHGLPERYAVATLHRPSNVDDADALTMVLDFIGAVSQRCPVVLPVHHRLATALDAFHLTETLPTSVQLLPPQPYVSFLRLMRESAFLLTDSGGIQEEAVLLQKRCFTLRRNTERPVTITCGSNKLVDPSRAEERALVLDFAQQPIAPHITVPPLWDGHAGERILDTLLSYA